MICTWVRIRSPLTHQHCLASVNTRYCQWDSVWLSDVPGSGLDWKSIHFSVFYSYEWYKSDLAKCFLSLRGDFHPLFSLLKLFSVFVCAWALCFCPLMCFCPLWCNKRHLCHISDNIMQPAQLRHIWAANWTTLCWILFFFIFQPRKL